MIKLSKILNINKEKKEKTSKKIVRNTAWVYSGFVFNILIGIALLPFIISHLGKDAYGVFAIVGVVIGYSSLLDFGIGTTLVKFISEYNAKKDYEKINKIISTAFILYFFLGSIGCAAILLSTNYLVTSLFHIPENLTDVSKIVFAVTAVTFLFNFVFGVFANVIIGLQRFDISTKIQIIMKAISTIAIVLVLYSGYGLLEFVIVSALLGVLGIIINIIIAKQLMPEISLIPRFFDFKYVKVITSFSFTIFIANIAGTIAFSIDKLLIGIFLPVEQVTIYVVGATLAIFIFQVPAQIASVIMPASSEFNAKENISALKELILNGTKFAVTLSTPIFIILFVLAYPIVNLWMGPGFETSAATLQILAIGFFINTFAHAITPSLVGVGKMKFYALSSIGYIILNIALSVPLILKFGVIGTAIGTSISITIWSLAILVYGMHSFNISPVELIKKLISVRIM